MNEQIVKQAQPAPIVKAEPTEALSVYLRKPEVIEKFALVLGNDAEALRYVQSVILAVETSDPGEYSLRNCTKNSILRCALKAATQRVTVNAEDRQAFMVPSRNNKIKDANGNGVIEARFQFHYQEIYNRAMRTNRYSVINVSPVFEGSEVFEDIYTGLHQVQLPNGLMTAGGEQVSRLRRVSDRKGNRIGWLGYYRTTRGQEKTIYLSMEEIERRAHFNKAHAYSFGWKDHRETMEMKTTLLALLRLADTKAPGMEELRDALSEIDQTEAEAAPTTESEQPEPEGEPITDAEAQDIPATEPAEVTAEEVAYAESCETLDFKGMKYGKKTDAELAIIRDNAEAPDVKRDAAKTILAWRASHSTEAKNMSELGF